jgi:hypothetical protein
LLVTVKLVNILGPVLLSINFPLFFPAAAEELPLKMK